MINNKLIKGLFVMVILIVAFASISGWASDSDKVVEIMLAHSSPAVNDRLEAACQEFKKFVEEKTNGKFKVTTYPASQLGGEREELEGVQMGTIQMAAVSTSPLPGIFSEIMVFDLPYLFSSEEIAYEVLDGPVGQEVLDMLRERTGVRGLVWGENGFRHFSNSIRPIEKPDDLKGLKIRTTESPAHMAIVRALGGSPTPISFPELYSALAQHVVDGQENGVPLDVSMRFYEVQKYLTLDGHVYNPYILFINDDFYNSLDDEIKKVIDEAAVVWRKIERELNKKQIEEGLKILKNEGIQITELSLKQKQAFREATKDVYENFGKKEIGEELINKVLDAVKKAESKYNR